MADIEQIRDDVRAYLRGHPTPQPDLAEQIGTVSHSWLNKFLNGQFDDLGAIRLNELVRWVAADRERRAESGQPPVTPRLPIAPAA